MRAIKRTFFVLAVLAIFLFGFIACFDEEHDTEGVIKFVIGTDTPVVYEVELEGIEITNGVLSILEHLRESEGLEFSAVTSVYGAYLTQVGDLAEDAAAGSYLCVYTSVEGDFDVSAYASSVSFEDKTLVSSGVGISEMTIKADCVIYIGIIAY